MKNKKSKVLFVYNANSSIFSQVTDFVHKTLSPDTYQCNLCKITYGSFKVKRKWQEYINSLTVPVEFLHKDEMRLKYPEVIVSLPAVLLVSKTRIEPLLSSQEINNASNVDSLIKILENKINHIKSITLD